MSSFQLFALSGPDKDRAFPLRDGTGHVLGRGQDSAYRLKREWRERRTWSPRR